ncbi:MAG: hypothetical protein GWN32_01055 [Gemmatimonadetes bacterium]|nr:hypothetical protein [Gemmatimonadota bacterium]
MIELVTLGDVTARRDGVELEALLSQRQQLALLIYLAIEGPTARTRLLSIFWPDREAERARHSLSQALYALRGAVGEDVLQLEGDKVSVAESACRVDALDLRAAAEDGDWERVIELYRGPFLDGFALPGAPDFEAWTSALRARLASDARRGFRRIIEAHRRAGDSAAALDAARRWSEVEPLDEGALESLEALQPDSTSSGSPSGGWASFLEGLKRRRFFRYLLVYLGAAWLALQLVDILVDRGVATPLVFRIVLTVVAIGLPLALLFAWTADRRERAAQEAAAHASVWARAAGAALAVAAAALLVLILIPVFRQLGPGSGVRSAPATRIAVLYFDDHSPNGRLRYLADALTEDVTHKLAQVSALEVLPRNAVKPFRDTGITNDSIAAVLGVGTLVEGSVLGYGDSVRVSVQLIDTRDMSHLTSAAIPGPADDPFELLDDVGNEIAQLLRRELGVEVQFRQWQTGTDSRGAWERMKQASAALDTYEDLVESGDTAAAARTLHAAELKLIRAEDADPDWIEPILQRGWIASRRARLAAGASEKHDPTHLLDGIAHAERALRIVPDDAGALELRGILRDRLAYETAVPDEAVALRRAAEDDLIRATELDPDRARAWSRLSDIWMGAGRHTEARLAAQRAYEADAFLRDARVILQRLCSTSMQLKDWDAVTRWCEEGRKRYPDRYTFPGTQLTALAGPEGPSADVDLAWELADRALTFSPSHRREELRPGILMQVAAVIARAGMDDSARAVIELARASADGPDPEALYQEANVRLILGERDAAIRLLEEFVEALPSEREFVAGEWWFESLHDDPRFQALVSDEP